MTDKKWFENYDKAPESFYNNAEYLFRDEIRKGDDQMTDTKHTPTPWKIENWHGDTQIIGPEGSLICIDTTYYPVAPSEEDMAHIVKCVNMHEELVEVIKAFGNEKISDAEFNIMRNETLKKAGAL